MKESLPESMSDATTSSVSALENALRDRSLHLGIAHPATSSVRHEYALLMNDLESGAQKHVADNVHLLSHLNGHRGAALRNLILHHPRTEEGKHLESLYKWSSDVVRGGGSPPFDSLLSETPLAPKDPESTYELISFLERNPHADRSTLDQERINTIAELLNMPGENHKWIDLVDPLTRALTDTDFLHQLLETVGSVPSEIYTKKVFKNIPPERIVKALETMRAQGSVDEEAHESDYERAKMLNYFLSSKNANALRVRGKKPATLDANGIFINIKGFHSHLPYGLCLPHTIDTLVQDRWLSEEEGNELRARTATENHDQDSYKTAREAQEAHFRGIYEKHLGVPTEEAIIHTPEKVADICVRGGVLPDAIIERMKESGSPEAVFSLMRLGELVSQRATDEVAEENGSSLHRPYHQLHVTERAYQVRSVVMNRPEYYNVTKIARHLLAEPLPFQDAETGYIRGSYKAREGDQHVFFEMLHKGAVARILLNETKHLGAHEKTHFEEIPLYGKEEYLAAENAVAAFDHFTRASKKIREALLLDSTTKGHIETCLDFLLTSVTEFYDDAAHFARSLTSASAFEQRDLLIALAQICDTAAKKYRPFLYRNLERPEYFREHLAPEVRKHDLHFGGATYEDVRAKTCEGGSDETLCRESQPIRVVTLHYKSEDPTATIPFHIEESALDALRINRDRPLINVIGGCKNLDRPKNGLDPLELMSKSIMTVAHEERANVAVPGTQSGIGITFGRSNIEYRAEYGHLPHSDRAHMFAISPGGSTYFPGNPFIAPEADVQSTYAITTADSILTPFEAGWGARGAEKLHTPYVHHIAYMESLYQRIAAEQKKIIVVGNGGFYSLLEINDSIRRGFEVLLIKDSGRFAELAAHMVEHPSVLEAFARDSSGDAKLLHLIRTSMPEASAQELCQKDFGHRESPENEDYQIYRDTLRIFARIIQNDIDKVAITPLSQLEGALRARMQK